MRGRKEPYFQRKMFRLIAAFLLSAFAILSAIIGIYAYRTSLRSAGLLLEETTENGAQRLEQMIRNMDAVSVQLAANSTIQSVFHDIALTDYKGNYFEDNFQVRKDVEVACSSINMAPNMVDAIYIFREPYNFFSYNTERYNKAQVLDFFGSEEIGKYKEYPNGYYNVLSPHINPWTSDDSTKVISLVRPLVDTYFSREEVATLEVQYQYSKLQRICSQDNSRDIELLVLDNSARRLVYPEEAPEPEEFPEVFEVTNGKVYTLKDDAGRKYAVYRNDLDNCDWSVFGIQEYGRFMSSTWIILSLITVLCIGFSAITLTGVFLVTKQLTQPIRKLRSALRDITLDDVTIPSEYEGNNEIELLQERFQQVLTALQRSARQISISQKAEYEARIEALQAQINPHFLYNSLMSISAAGQEGDALKLQNMCSQLSDIFRYASSSGSEATLKQELKSVENYLTFMKFRYLDDLDFSMKACEGTEKIKVPKLILQPIIENCFRHGFYTIGPPYFVSIECGTEGNKWFIKVIDNGSGFSVEKLKEIDELKEKIDDDLRGKDYVRSMDIKNMALLNIYARLRVRYRENTVFKIENPEGGGAAVEIGGGSEEKHE